MQNTSVTTVNILKSLNENTKGSIHKKVENIILKNTQTRGEQVFRGTTRMYHIGTPFVVQPTHHPVRKAAAYTAIAWVNVYNPTNTIACLLPP